jgi:hypothetical protein
MPKRHGRILGSLAAVIAAGLAGFSLRPSPQPVTAVASRNPAEVKTQVIRRTIHIVHRQGSGQAAERGRHGRPGSGTRSVRTGASRFHATGSTTGVGGGAAAVATRTSGSHVAPAASSGSAGGSSGTPVTTRTSASHPASGSPGSQPSTGSPGAGSSPVTTRTSGSHTASGSPAAGTGTGSKPVTSRTSGGKSGGEDKGDHGD